MDAKGVEELQEPGEFHDLDFAFALKYHDVLDGKLKADVQVMDKVRKKDGIIFLAGRQIHFIVLNMGINNFMVIVKSWYYHTLLLD